MVNLTNNRKGESLFLRLVNLSKELTAPDFAGRLIAGHTQGPWLKTLAQPSTA